MIAGFDWKAGDEAVMANQDYKAMLWMFNLQAKRYGMVNRLVDIPLDPKSDDEIVQVYARALTPRTRLLLIPHMVNVTGHILPVRAICDMAHERGVPVLVEWRTRICSLRVPDSGPALRLLRRLAAQMAGRSAGRGHPLCETGSHREALADLRQ